MSLQPARDSNGHWLKGYSGNPGGRATEQAQKEVRRLARLHTEEAVERLVEIMSDPKSQAMARVQAAKELLARGWGQPSDETLLDAADTGDRAPIVFRFRMSEDDEEIDGEFADDERRAIPPPAA